MATNSSHRSFFLKAMDSLIDARQRQADRYVSNVLLSLDDKTLAASGYDRAELVRKSRSRF